MEKIPFIFGRSTDAVNFTGRERESEFLASNFTSLINTTIFSPRRWGKASLVRAVANTVMENNSSIKVCFLDLFNVRSESDFYVLLAKEVLKATANSWEDVATNARDFLSQLLPKISFSPDLQAEISFGIGCEALQRNPDDVINLAEYIARTQNIRIIVCIDEFQAIDDFADSLAFQQKLHSLWQRHRRVAYCLCGSKRHVLLDIFANASMPFYKFGDIIFLPKINNTAWKVFIKRRFEENGKKITRETASYIAARVDHHSYYVQQLAQQSWLRCDKICTKEIIDSALQSIKNQLDLLFTGVIEGLSTPQINFLRAVLDNKNALSSQAALQNYHLGSSGNLAKIKAALADKEIIDIQEKNVVIVDPIFTLWLKEDYFKLTE
jgi:hypothetical protein